MRNIVYYFSGTGNTDRAVGIIAGDLASAGQETQTEVIRAGVSPENPPESFDRVIVAFPTLALAPPNVVRRFIRRLSSRGSISAARITGAVLAVDAGGCGPAPRAAARLLRARGFDVALTDHASYAENWVQLAFVPHDDEEAARKTVQGDLMSRAFAKKLLSGTREEFKPSVGASILGPICAFLFTVFGRRFFGKTYFADAACRSCGLCARSCPAGTIVLPKRGGARPVWKTNCEGCNRCMNICPRKAINISIPRFALLLGLVIALSIAGMRFWGALAWRLFGSALAPGLWGPCLFITDAILILLTHVLVIGPLDAWLIRCLQRIPLLDRFFALSYSRKIRRYTAPGFSPGPAR